MMRVLLTVSLALAFVAGLGGVALADHPDWDPSVGYSPDALDAALEKAKNEAPKETPKALAPTVPRPGGKPATTTEGWEPYKHPHPTGN